MASNTPTPTPTGAGPLSFMTRLSPDIYHFRPPTAPKDAPAAPEMILLATWMGAREAHIAKYIHPYRAMYPTAEILLIRSEAVHFLRHGAFKASLRAIALPVLRGCFEEADMDMDSTQGKEKEGKKENPRLLIHILSGGGSLTLILLRTLLSSPEPPYTNTLPPHTLIYDSAPPQYSFSRSRLAFSQSLPPSQIIRLLLTPLLYTFLVFHFLQHRIMPLFFSSQLNPLAHIAAAHNERQGRAKTEIRRVYIYGEADELVRWQDVESHGREAQREGFKVRMEKFERGGHVAWMRGEGERYWGVVRGVWEGGEGWGEGR